MSWNNVLRNPPPGGIILRTRLNDEHGIRNEQTLVFERNLWWTPDRSMYVYYRPTEWMYADERDLNEARKHVRQRVEALNDTIDRMRI